MDRARHFLVLQKNPADPRSIVRPDPQFSNIVSTVTVGLQKAPQFVGLPPTGDVRHKAIFHFQFQRLLYLTDSGK